MRTINTTSEMESDAGKVSWKWCYVWSVTFTFQKRGVASLANAAAEHSYRQETNVDMIRPTSQYLAYARHTEDDLSVNMDKKDDLSLTIDKKDDLIQVFFQYLYITTFFTDLVMD